MKINTTLYFNTIDERAEWHAVVQDAIPATFPGLAHTIEDVDNVPGYIIGRVIYKPGTKYRAVVCTTKNGVTSITFTNTETAESGQVAYTTSDPGYIGYEISAYD